MMGGWFDPVYFIFLGPAILLALWAQFRVKSTYAEAQQVPARSGVSGAQAADHLLRSVGITDVVIEPVEGYLSDHYVPGQKVLRLSPEVYTGRSLAALGIAAHESGHAMQDAGRYPLLVVRNGLVPLAGIGSNVSFLLIFLGIALGLMNLTLLGILAFSATVVFQLVNLPVEFDASRRARAALLDSGLVTAEEDGTVGRVLNAAALTYVAATLTAVLTLLYYLFRSGLLGGRREG
jgi:Zn-dependent membrane protease YugP